MKRWLLCIPVMVLLIWGSHSSRATIIGPTKSFGIMSAAGGSSIAAFPTDKLRIIGAVSTPLTNTLTITPASIGGVTASHFGTYSTNRQIQFGTVVTNIHFNIYSANRQIQINSKAATNQTMYIGTTSHAINRASASEALTGISSIDGSAATLTTPRAINGVNFNGSAAITINAVDSTARVAQSQTINSVAYGSGNIQTSTANTSDYTTGTWTPTFNNLTVVNGTGGVTYAGRYTAIGNVVYFTVTITPSGTATTASTNNSTSFDPPVGTITARGNVTATSNFIENFGVGSIYSGSAVYTPTWAATNHLVFISGFYFR